MLLRLLAGCVLLQSWSLHHVWARGEAEGAEALAAPRPSCLDGIRNGEEESVDCGGDTCLPCGEERTAVSVVSTYSWRTDGRQRSVPTRLAVYQVSVVAPRDLPAWNLTVHFTDPVTILATHGLVTHSANAFHNIYMFTSADWNGNIRALWEKRAAFIASYDVDRPPHVASTFFNCGDCKLYSTAPITTRLKLS